MFHSASWWNGFELFLLLFMFMRRDERGMRAGSFDLVQRQRDELSRLAGGARCWEQQCQQERLVSQAEPQLSTEPPNSTPSEWAQKRRKPHLRHTDVGNAGLSLPECISVIREA